MPEHHISGSVPQILPEVIAAYAVAAGWRKSEKYGEYSHVYAGDGLPEVVIPHTTEISDYERVLSRLIYVFSHVLDFNENQIRTDLRFADRDVIRFSIPSESDPGLDATILPDVARGLRNLLRAAALSECAPRPNHVGRANAIVSDLLNGVRFWHTERGSYVVVMLTPVIEYRDRTIWDIPAKHPFPRRVTRRLVTGLNATKNIIGQGMDDQIVEAVTSGVSANLLDALCLVADPFPKVALDITWAKTLRMSNPVETIRFTKDNVSVLGEVAAQFKSNKISRNEKVSGLVKRLSRTSNEEMGTISLETEIDGQARVVTAVLGATDYDKAIGAHKDRVEIILDGDLIKEGRKWHLFAPEVVGTK